MLILLILMWSLQVDRDLHNLVRTGGEHNMVLARGKRDRLDRLNVDIGVDHLRGGVVVAEVVLADRVQVIASVNTNVGLFRIDIALDKDPDAAALTCNNETALRAALHFALGSGGATSVGHDAAESGDGHDREGVLARIRNSDALVLTCSVEQHDLSVVVADNEATSWVIEPGVARVIGGVVLLVLPLVDLVMDYFEIVRVKLVVAVQVVTGNNDDAWISRAK